MRHGPYGRAGAALLAIAFAFPVTPTVASTPPPADDGTIVHALNRLGYGPRPGDVERVRVMGLTRWIDQQLHPEGIPEKEIDGRLNGLTTLALSSGYLVKHYEIPPQARKELAERKAEMGDNTSPADMKRVRQDLMAKYGQNMEGDPRQVVDELQQAKILRAVYGERQLDEVLVDFWMNHFNVYADKGQDRFLIGAYEREAVRPHAWGHYEDLLRATAESPAMLFYLDNWLSADPNARPAGDRRRPRGGGRFADPSAPMQSDGTPKPAATGRKRGLNENYAREIMELHTLGVDGGYTQKDVTEVARCFTGWTIRGLARGPRERSQDPDPRFVFNPAIHDRGDKVVLGHTIHASGKGEGDEVIHILATHPATARFVSLKLARRFVSDNPPASLVDRAAETFGKTDGDIRAVVATIVTSPEFFAREARAAKVKTPLEFVVSSVRASGAQVSDAAELARRAAAMGMPLYRQQPPTGYKDTADAWVSTGGLLARLNFALDLTSGKLNGTTVPVDAAAVAVSDVAARTAALEARLVPGGLSDQTRKTLTAEAGSGLAAARMAGLILGSPEFQRK